MMQPSTDIVAFRKKMSKGPCSYFTQYVVNGDLPSHLITNEFIHRHLTAYVKLLSIHSNKTSRSVALTEVFITPTKVGKANFAPLLCCYTHL